MNPWSLLPNAHHIDWVLQSVRSNLDVWVAVFHVTGDATWREAWDAAYDAACCVAARDAAYDAAWTAVRDAACCDAAFAAARDAILALIAYDDCDQYLQMTYEQLSVYAVLSDKPQAVLLLPFKWVQENEQPMISTA